MPRLLLLLSAFLLAACEIPPSHVSRGDIEDAVVRGRYKTVCVGLDMPDDEVRRFATAKLVDVKDEPIAVECVCEHVRRNGHWDEAVARGLEGSKRDDMVSCLAALLDDPATQDKDKLVMALIRTAAPMVPAKLAEVAAAPGDPAVRANAVKGLAGSKEPERRELLLRLLRKDEAPEVRAAAAKVLVAWKDEEVLAALRDALAHDTAPEVRVEALRSLNRLRVEDRDQLICSAMMEDPSPEVRKVAVSMYKGTKRPEAIACLRQKALSVEEDPGVRAALLEAIKASPKQEAADILCDAIPFWLEHYATDDIPGKDPSTDIVKAQNDRDWRNSYACFAKAYAKRSRYSCYGTKYIAYWFREVGGKSFIPTCPGDPPPAVRSGGGVVSGSGVTVSGH